MSEPYASVSRSDVPVRTDFDAPVSARGSATADVSSWQAAGRTDGVIDVDLIDRAVAARGGPDPKIWDTLLGGDPSAPPSADALALNRPAAVADYLAAQWSALGLPDAITPEFMADPPKTLPPEVSEMLRFIAQNPAAMNAIDASDGWGAPNDGTIWKLDLEDFASGAGQDVQRAAAAHTVFLNDHADASSTERSAAQSVALLAANQRLLTAAGHPDSAGGDELAVEERMLPSNLAAIRNNPSLAPRLAAAASFAEDNGLLRDIAPSSSASADELIVFLESGGPSRLPGRGGGVDSGPVRILPMNSRGA